MHEAGMDILGYKAYSRVQDPLASPNRLLGIPPFYCLTRCINIGFSRHPGAQYYIGSCSDWSYRCRLSNLGIGAARGDEIGREFGNTDLLLRRFRLGTG
jgi:hypothetical protein